jgi:hypothetical protein
MPDPKDIDKPAGWLVEVVTPGGPKRYWKVFELEQTKAVEMAKKAAMCAPNETVRAIKQLNLHEFANMKPGELVQHV